MNKLIKALGLGLFTVLSCNWGFSQDQTGPVEMADGMRQSGY
jgi:hypothetical protein